MPSVPAAEKLTRYEGDPWTRQPTETARQFARFTMYLKQARGGRNLSEVAREYGLSESTVREAAERGRWRERAALYDADQDTRQLEQISVKEGQLRERAINLALVTASLMARTLRALADDPNAVIEAKDLPQWAKMAETLRKIAIDAPDQTVALTGPVGVSVPDFSGLSQEQITDRAAEMARSMLRVMHGGKTG